MISGDLYWPTTDKPPEVVMKSEARKEAEKLGANAIGKQSHMTSPQRNGVFLKEPRLHDFSPKWGQEGSNLTKYFGRHL